MRRRAFWRTERGSLFGQQDELSLVIRNDPADDRGQVLQQVTKIVFYREGRQHIVEHGQLLAGVRRRIDTQRHLRLRLRALAPHIEPNHSVTVPPSLTAQAGGRPLHVDAHAAWIQTGPALAGPRSSADLGQFTRIARRQRHCSSDVVTGAKLGTRPVNEEADLRRVNHGAKNSAADHRPDSDRRGVPSDFLERPLETLRSLRERGVELTNVEIDALAQTDRRFWLIGAEWIDARFQRCRLVGGQRT